jgi:hypothetical protein
MHIEHVRLGRYASFNNDIFDTVENQFCIDTKFAILLNERTKAPFAAKIIFTLWGRRGGGKKKLICSFK